MPRATIDPTELHHRDLKTCPGGYVKLRTLSFHEMNTRMDIAARMYQEQKTPQPGKRRVEQDSVRSYLEVMNVSVTEYEFRNCIIEHNLYVDDAETQLIDFTRPMQTWKLDPRVGQEISDFIAELTQVADEEEMLPLPTALSSSSSGEESELETTSTES